jgi:hypothetical protein
VPQPGPKQILSWQPLLSPQCALAAQKWLAELLGLTGSHVQVDIPGGGW